MVDDRHPEYRISAYDDAAFDEEAVETAARDADEAAFQAWVDFSEGQCDDDEKAPVPPTRACVTRGSWRLQVAPSKRSQPTIASPLTRAVPHGTTWGAWPTLREKLVQFFQSWPSNAPLMAAPIPTEAGH